MSRNVLLWGLYDFANTPITVALGGLYLAQWVVLDMGFDELWYGLTFVFSTILLLITSPFWGAWSDKLGKRMPFIARMTFALIFFGGLLAFVATSSFPKALKVTIALIIFFFLQYFYQTSRIFYDALLSKLSTPKTRGKISGIGDAFDEIGWIIGPAILLPFASGKITLIGEPGRAQVFLPAVFLLVIFALPMIFWFREPKTRRRKEKIDFNAVYKKTLRGLKDLIGKEKNVTLFLVAFMLVSDAMLTASLYFGIFFDQIYKISDFQKVLILTLMQIFAIPGTFFIGSISDRYGAKRMLIIICIPLIIGISLVALSSSLWVLYLFSLLGGVGMGAFSATARALLVKISPALQLGEYFGFFAVFERFASILGPLVWGAVTLIFKEYGLVRYRLAGLSLIFLMIFGTLLLTRVKEERAVS